MAKNNITVNRNYMLGVQLLNIVDGQAQIVASMRKLKAQMDNMTDNVDWTVIETQLGLTAGKGQTTYNLVAGSLSEVDGDPNLNNLITWITPV